MSNNFAQFSHKHAASIHQRVRMRIMLAYQGFWRFMHRYGHPFRWQVAAIETFAVGFGIVCVEYCECLIRILLATRLD